MSDARRSKEELIAELAELRTAVAELRARERAHVATEQQLRKELKLVSENARNTASILRSTIELSTKAARELRMAKREAESATRTKSRFLANMSHEIRTPMTAILGYADLLLEEGDLSRAPASRIDCLQTLKRSGKHLMRILDDVLDLSKIEAGKIQIETIETSLQEVLSDVDSVMRHAAEERGLSFELSSDGPTPAFIQTDPTRLRQILMNLVGNAVKFTERGGVRLVAALGLSPAGDHTLSFKVQDTGIGLSPEAQSRIFDPFDQADASTTREFGGSGLGLTISKQLAELLGGSLSVESIEGHGSTFTLTIPTGPLDGAQLAEGLSDLGVAEEEIVLDNEDTTRAYLESVRSRCEGVRLLLVEDGEDNRRLISFALEKAGFSVTQAIHGQSGVDLALEARDVGHPYDLILMDMQMPVLDGYSATQVLRGAGYTGPIVALTAHAMKGDRERCLEVGCDGFSTKPIRRRELVQTILTHLEKAADA
jgi:signal transduction histidine kinase/ActR/RegA family two-component response regulator